MAISVFKTWSAGEVLTASDLNSSFTQITGNALTLISPITGTLDMNGNKLDLDADADTSITADTDDQIDIEIAGADRIIFTDGTYTFNSADAGAAAEPILILHRNSASPAVSDVIGELRFDGEDDGDNQETYAAIQGRIDDETATTEDGALVFRTVSGGTVADRMTLVDGELELLHTDAGAGIGPSLSLYRNSASPTASDLLGEIRFDGEDSADNKETYGGVRCILEDATSGSENAAIILRASVGGSVTNIFYASGTSNACYIGDTSNANASGPSLTINQNNGQDDGAFFLKSSDVGHAATDEEEADTYCVLEKQNAAGGGARIRGYNEQHAGLELGAVVGDVSTSRNTSAIASVVVHAYRVTGSALSTVTANQNVLGVYGASDEFKWVVDAEGDTGYDGTDGAGAWDEHDDIALLNTFRHVNQKDKGFARRVFGEFVEENAKILDETGVITYNENGHHFVSTKGLNGLIIDSIRQTASRLVASVEVLEDMLPGFAAAYNDRLAEQGLPQVEIGNG